MLATDEWYMPAYRQGLQKVYRHVDVFCASSSRSTHERCERARAGMTTGTVYIGTFSVAPGVSFRAVAAIRISIAPPSTSVACTVLPAIRIATVRPLQRTRNDMLRH